MGFRNAFRHRAQGLPRSFRELERSLQLLGTFRGMGWHRSTEGVPMTLGGEPLPWIVYPAISWLDARVTSTDNVFEYGAGASTLWFAARASTVTSVEHQAAWAERIRKRMPESVGLEVVSATDETGLLEDCSPYACAIEETPDTFDVVLIDGMHRNECLARAPAQLAADGIIVLDNSDRSVYAPGIAFLHDAGFWRIDFLGVVPGFGLHTATSVFGRSLERWLSVHAPLKASGW